MAIKAISKLEQFNNVTEGDKLGGQLQIFDSNLESDLTPERCQDSNVIDDPLVPISDISYNNGTYSQSFFEISQPSTPGRQLRSEFYNSKKLTYEQLIKNVCADVKSYLNAKNNLSCINIAQLASGGYKFNGSKTFSGGDVKIENGNTLFVNSIKSATGSISVESDAVLTTTTINGELYANKGLSVDNGTLSVNGEFYVTDILSACEDKVTTTNMHCNNLSADDLLGINSISLSNCFTATQDSFTISTALNVSGEASFADSISVANIINATDISCTNLSCSGIADLIALHARWSDLAEYYKADAQYEPGTLVKFGGINEITIADDQANAIVTSKPAIIMNNNLKDDPLGCAIALAGRVPVKIKGKINKFDRICLSDQNGVACAVDSKDDACKSNEILGRALEESNDTNIKLIECVVKFNI